MKRLFVTMAFLSCCFTCNAQPDFFLPLIGKSPTTAVEALESLGLKKVPLRDFYMALYEINDDIEKERLKVTYEEFQEHADTVVERQIEQGALPYAFKGNFFTEDNGYLVLKKSKKGKIDYVSIFWFRPNMSSLLQIYKNNTIL